MLLVILSPCILHAMHLPSAGHDTTQRLLKAIVAHDHKQVAYLASDPSIANGIYRDIMIASPLRASIKTGNTQVMRTLLYAGADPSSEDATRGFLHILLSSYHPAFPTCRVGNVLTSHTHALISRLKNENVLLDLVLDTHHASAFDKVHWLLQHGISPDTYLANGDTLLEYVLRIARNDVLTGSTERYHTGHMSLLIAYHARWHGTPYNGYEQEYAECQHGWIPSCVYIDPAHMLRIMMGYRHNNAVFWYLSSHRLSRRCSLRLCCDACLLNNQPMFQHLYQRIDNQEDRVSVHNFIMTIGSKQKTDMLSTIC